MRSLQTLGALLILALMVANPVIPGLAMIVEEAARPTYEPETVGEPASSKAPGWSQLSGGPYMALISSLPIWNIRERVVISGDADLTPANGVIGGSGTPSDPYIINLVVNPFYLRGIESAQPDFALEIHNVTKYVVVNAVVYGYREILVMNSSNIVLVLSSGSDVVIENSTNISIVNSTIGSDLEVYSSQNVLVNSTWVDDDLEVYSSQNVSIEYTTIYDDLNIEYSLDLSVKRASIYDDLDIDSSTGVTVVDTVVNDGVDVRYSSNIIIADSTMWNDVEIDYSSNISIIASYIDGGLGETIDLWESSMVVIADSTLDAWGDDFIEIDDSSNVVVRNINLTIDEGYEPFIDASNSNNLVISNILITIDNPYNDTYFSTVIDLYRVNDTLLENISTLGDPLTYASFMDADDLANVTFRNIKAPLILYEPIAIEIGGTGITMENINFTGDIEIDAQEGDVATWTISMVTGDSGPLSMIKNPSGANITGSYEALIVVGANNSAITSVSVVSQLILIGASNVNVDSSQAREINVIDSADVTINSTTANGIEITGSNNILVNSSSIGFLNIRSSSRVDVNFTSMSSLNVRDPRPDFQLVSQGSTVSGNPLVSLAGQSVTHPTDVNLNGTYAVIAGGSLTINGDLNVTKMVLANAVMSAYNSTVLVGIFQAFNSNITAVDSLVVFNGYGNTIDTGNIVVNRSTIYTPGLYLYGNYSLALDNSTISSSNIYSYEDSQSSAVVNFTNSTIQWSFISLFWRSSGLQVEFTQVTSYWSSIQLRADTIEFRDSSLSLSSFSFYPMDRIAIENTSITFTSWSSRIEILDSTTSLVIRDSSLSNPSSGDIYINGWWLSNVTNFTAILEGNDMTNVSLNIELVLVNTSTTTTIAGNKLQGGQAGINVEVTAAHPNDNVILDISGNIIDSDPSNRGQGLAVDITQWMPNNIRVSIADNVIINTTEGVRVHGNFLAGQPLINITNNTVLDVARAYIAISGELSLLLPGISIDSLNSFDGASPLIIDSVASGTFDVTGYPLVLVKSSGSITLTGYMEPLSVPSIIAMDLGSLTMSGVTLNYTRPIFSSFIDRVAVWVDNATNFNAMGVKTINSRFLEVASDRVEIRDSSLNHISIEASETTVYNTTFTATSTWFTNYVTSDNIVFDIVAFDNRFSVRYFNSTAISDSWLNPAAFSSRISLQPVSPQANFSVYNTTGIALDVVGASGGVINESSQLNISIADSEGILILGSSMVDVILDSSTDIRMEYSNASRLSIYGSSNVTMSSVIVSGDTSVFWSEDVSFTGSTLNSLWLRLTDNVMVKSTVATEASVVNSRNPLFMDVALVSTSSPFYYTNNNPLEYDDITLINTTGNGLPIILLANLTGFSLLPGSYSYLVMYNVTDSIVADSLIAHGIAGSLVVGSRFENVTGSAFMEFTYSSIEARNVEAMGIASYNTIVGAVVEDSSLSPANDRKAVYVRGLSGYSVNVSIAGVNVLANGSTYTWSFYGGLIEATNVDTVRIAGVNVTVSPSSYRVDWGVYLDDASSINIDGLFVNGSDDGLGVFDSAMVTIAGLESHSFVRIGGVQELVLRDSVISGYWLLLSDYVGDVLLYNNSVSILDFWTTPETFMLFNNNFTSYLELFGDLVVATGNYLESGWIALPGNTTAAFVYLNTFNATISYIGSGGSILNSSSPVDYYYNGLAFNGFVGNYWRNYGGSDADGDGTGDTPFTYTLGSNSVTDYAPLVQPHWNYTAIEGFTVSPQVSNVTVFVNQTALHNFTVANLGNVTITLSASATSGSLNASTIVVPPLLGATVTLSYTPSSSGTFESNVTFIHPQLASYNETVRAITVAQVPPLPVIAVKGLSGVIFLWENGTWTPLPGATNNSVDLARCGNTIYIAVRTLSGGIVVGAYDQATDTFLGWTSIPGATPSRPAIAVDQSCSKIYVVVRGLSNVIFYTILYPNMTWSGAWSALPGITDDDPSAAVANGTLYVAVKSPIGKIFLWNGSSWIQVPGLTDDAPSLASNGTHLLLAVKGANTTGIFVGYYTASGFQGWANIPGATDVTPEVAFTPNGWTLVVKGLSGVIFTKPLNSGPWQPVPGVTDRSPAST